MCCQDQEPRSRWGDYISYALILVLVAIVVIFTLLLISPHISNILSRINNTITGG